MLGGAELIGMHRNPWWLTPAGPTLDAGAFLVGLEWATERRARIVGKPSPAFFTTAIERLAAEAARARRAAPAASELAMVGDDVNSDIGGGRRAGLRTVFVRTGKHGDAELAAAAGRRRGAYAPDGVAPSILEVVRPCPELVPARTPGSKTGGDVPAHPAGRVTRTSSMPASTLEAAPPSTASNRIRTTGRPTRPGRWTPIRHEPANAFAVPRPLPDHRLRPVRGLDDRPQVVCRRRRRGRVREQPAEREPLARSGGSVIGAERTVVRPSRS